MKGNKELSTIIMGKPWEAPFFFLMKICQNVNFFIYMEYSAIIFIISIK